MNVKIIDRRGGRVTYWEGEIGNKCLECGGPRGEAVRANLCSDEYPHGGIGWHNIDSWNNPCGHVEPYGDVLRSLQPEVKT